HRPCTGHAYSGFECSVCRSSGSFGVSTMLTRLRTSLAKMIAPAAPIATRRFDGAAGGRRGNGMGHFGPIQPEVSAAGATVRSRARYLASNNSWLSHAVSNWTGSLVGAGIVPTAKHPDAATRKALI